jgi:hypothetical protein
MDKIEKLEMEVEVLRNVVKNMAKKLGIDPEFDKMNFIPETDLIEKEPVRKNFFIANRIEHSYNDIYGGGTYYSYFPYNSKSIFIDSEGKIHEETYIYTFDTLEDALKAWNENAMFDTLGLYIYNETNQTAMSRKAIRKALKKFNI